MKQFRRLLKSFSFLATRALSALEIVIIMHYINPHLHLHTFTSSQRLLNAAARVISNTGKFNRGLTHLLHSELHWLDVPQRILHKLGVTVHRCLHLRQGSPVPCELLPPHIGRCQSSATSIFQPPPSRRSTTSSQHARPSGVLRRRSDGLECAA